jgi:hypothetical protein
MLCVHFAEAHLWPLPEAILQAQRAHDDPDRRIIALFSARRLVPRGSQVAATKITIEKSSLVAIF